MTIKSTFKTQEFDVQIHKKHVKRTYLRVLPPHGDVRIIAPLSADDDELKDFALRKLRWIRLRRMEFKNVERQAPREYVSGEDYYFLGSRYRLKLISSSLITPHVAIENKSYLQLYARPNTSIKRKEKIMHDFYRAELLKRIPQLIKKWAPRINTTPNEVLIKKMKTRWGVCLPRKKRIWLNLELAKYAPHLLEYVFVHEMVHFLESRHNERFHELMNTFIPPWERYEEQLNELVLGFFKWKDR